MNCPICNDEIEIVERVNPIDKRTYLDYYCRNNKDIHKDYIFSFSRCFGPDNNMNDLSQATKIWVVDNITRCYYDITLGTHIHLMVYKPHVIEHVLYEGDNGDFKFLFDLIQKNHKVAMFL